MKVLQRYLGSTIFNAIALVLLILAGLEIFIAFVGQLSDIGTGEYSLYQAMMYVLLDLPQQLYHLFPMAGLIGGLIGLGLLASHSELIVMRASGVSLNQISIIILKITLVMVLAASLIGEIIAPFTEHLAESRKAIAISNGQALKTTQGTWVRDGSDFIHIRSINPGERLEGVSRYQFDNQHRLVSTSYAQSGYYQNKHWILQNVRKSIISNDSVESTTQAQAEWTLSLSPHVLRISEVEPSEMSLTELYSYSKYGRENGLHVNKYEFAYWKRIFQPLATIVMIFLAIPFIFGPLRSATMGLRILAGIVVGFGFYISNEFLGPFSMVYQFPAVIAAALPIVLFAIVAFLMLRRAY